MSTLETLNFDNLALKSLPVDKDERNCIRQVEGACFSFVEPTQVLNPKTVAYSASAMALLDLPETELQRSDFAEYFSGNKLLPGAKPAAHCYCGHQFGYFSGQLGDGAAMYLGEILNEKGERWEIQFKGAGLTPYSRTADGRKVLRSSIREFLCSEAMYHLGIPTTRAGSCVTSDTTVIRDIFYDGNPIKERASIILRIAPTFLRFGSFEIFKPLDKMTGRKGPSVGRADILEELLNYSIKTFFPQVYEAHPDTAEERYLAFYKQVVHLTASLVAEWQCVGFCHGVLNTDNMSILGLTIDYGPFGFLDTFDPSHVCNGSDDQGRYSYKNQPEMCKWNLLKFAEAIQDALPIERSTAVLEELYDTKYKACYMSKMRKKLGLVRHELPEDEELVESLLETMHQTGSDFTNTFRSLHRISIPGNPAQVKERSNISGVIDIITQQCQTVDDLKKATKPQMDIRQYQMLLMLLQSNPDLAAQLGTGVAALQQEMAKREIANTLKDLTPDAKLAKDKELWSAWLTKYRSRLLEEALGQDQCVIDATNEERLKVMKANNPRFILRNYIAQNVISLAEKGDYSEVWKVLKLLENPYSDDVNINVEVRQFKRVETESGESLTVPETPTIVNLSCSHDGMPFDSKPPSWTLDIKVT